MKKNFFNKYVFPNLGWVISVFWTIVGIINFYFQNEVISSWLNNKLVFWILASLFLVYVANKVYIKFRSVELKLPNNSIIQLSSKDITKFFKKKDIAFVFSSSNFFNTKNSIVGKELASKYLKKSELEQDDIQEQITSSLGSAKYEIIENTNVTLDGNKKSFHPGSIAYFKNKNISHVVYLLAITKIKAEGDRYSASCKKSDIVKALSNVWNEVTKRERVETICLPAIGSGMAQAYNDSNASALDICRSFINYSIENKVKVCKRMIISCNNNEFDKDSIVSALLILYPEIQII